MTVIHAPWGAWARMPPSYWSLWPQGGGNECPFVRHLCPLGRDHDDPFHISLDMPGHVTPALCAIFCVLSKFISVHSSSWGRHFFTGAVRRALVFTSKNFNFCLWGSPSRTILANKTNIFYQSRITDATRWEDQARCS